MKIANGKHIFRSEMLVGNFGVLFKTFRKFWKFSGREQTDRQTPLFSYKAQGKIALPFIFQPKFTKLFGKW